MNQPSQLYWRDRDGKEWDVLLDPQRLAFRSDDAEIILAQSDWARDLLISPLGPRVAVRVETFDHALAFVLDQRDAEPFLRHLGALPSSDRAGHRTGPNTIESAERSTPPPLLWPKVSPLAVWALIAAAPTFVPVLGWITGAIALLLIVLHQRRIRSNAAWWHSRVLCAAALAFILLGLPVSLLATRSFFMLNADPIPSPVESKVPTLHRGAAEPPTARAPQQAQAARSILDGDHPWGLIAAGLIVLILSLSVHEAAHAITAWWLGDDFARRLGRVTMNPTAHIDPVGTIILPLVLFLMGAGVFGWARPVPVRTEVFSRPRRDHMLVALAGPGSNLLLAAAALMLLLGIGCAVALWAPQATLENLSNPNPTASVVASGIPLANVVGPLCTVLKLAFLLNVFLAFFNLIPLPPLDGSWVLAHLFPGSFGAFFERIRPYSFILFVLVLYSGLFQYLMYPALLALLPGVFLLQSCTPF